MPSYLDGSRHIWAAHTFGCEHRQRATTSNPELCECTDIYVCTKI